jgi:ribosomal protein S27E
VNVPVCPGCSANLEFDPENGSLKCPYCGRVEAVTADLEAGAPEEIPIEVALGAAAQTGSLSARALEVSCPSCGATVQFEPPLVAGACSFCAARIVAQPKAADPLISPQGVLPFAWPKAQAVGAVRQWLGSRWFAPNDLQRMAQPDGLDGVYLPFWTFDAQTTTFYEGARGDYYYVSETYTTRENGRPVTRTRQVRRTRWTPASGRVGNAFDDVLVPATTAIPASRLMALEPWPLANVKPYEPAYLAGFKAQRYQIDLPGGLAAAKQRMASAIAASVRQAIGGDEQQILRMSTRYAGVTFKHLLLPVWVGAFRYRDKVYQLTVNATTGEVQGERPYSAWKIALAVLAALLVVLALVLLKASG